MLNKPLNRYARSCHDIALVAPVSVPYERKSEHGPTWFIGTVLRELLEKSKLEKNEIDGLAVSSFTLVPDTVVSLTTHFSLTLRWAEHVPLGGASGIVALRRASRAVQAGDAEIVACIGSDTNSAQSFHDIIANFSSFSSDAVHPYGGGGPNTVFGMVTRNYMQKYGATREDFGRICITQRTNALASGRAIFNGPLTMEDYLTARPIAEPLHLFDCVMPCAGGEGFLVMTTERAEKLGLSYSRILSSAELYNDHRDDAIQIRGGWTEFQDQLYSDAGIDPSEVDFIQTYDDYPVMVMMQLEGLGFCDLGEAPTFVRENQLTWNGGGFPHNTSGGQLSVGQAGAAGGYLGLVEAIRQLTMHGLPNAVPDARVGIVSGYGMVIYDRGVSSNAVLLARV